MSLAIGLSILFGNMYTRNLEHNYGAQGVMDAFWNNPYFVVWKAILGITIGFQPTMATLDCMLIIATCFLSGCVS